MAFMFYITYSEIGEVFLQPHSFVTSNFLPKENFISLEVVAPFLLLFGHVFIRDDTSFLKYITSLTEGLTR